MNSLTTSWRGLPRAATAWAAGWARPTGGRSLAPGAHPAPRATQQILAGGAAHRPADGPGGAVAQDQARGSAGSHAIRAEERSLRLAEPIPADLPPRDGGRNRRRPSLPVQRRSPCLRRCNIDLVVAECGHDRGKFRQPLEEESDGCFWCAGQGPHCTSHRRLPRHRAAGRRRTRPATAATWC
jgi:hypothetical protein